MYELLISAQMLSAEATQSPSINSSTFYPLVIYGGVAVAVIIALTYYNQVLLKLIIKLVSANRNS